MNLVKTKNPLKWVPTVYFAMGFPLITISMVSVVMFKDLGVSNDEIARYTSLLLLPWSFKPLFSIIMELFGTKRKYIIFAEFISAIMLGAVVFALPLPDFFKIAIAFMGVMAISGSVHDIAGDGIYMEQLDTETQSKYSGWQGAFYNMAKVLANGGLVFLAGWLSSHLGFSPVESWQSVMAISAGIMALVAFYHIFMLPKDIRKKTEGNFKEKLQELWFIIKDFFTKKYIIYYLFFIFFYRFAEGLAMKVAPMFLKDSVANGGLDLSNESYGLIYGTFGAVAFIAGSILAGYYISKFGLKKTLFTLALAFNIPFVVYLLLAMFHPHSLYIVSVGIVFEYFGYGFGFVGLILFMMQQIAPGKYQMTHYAFANSIMNLSVLVPGIVSGFLSEKPNQIMILNKLNLTHWVPQEFLGYELFFMLVMVFIIPALLMTWFVPFTYDDEKK